MRRVGLWVLLALLGVAAPFLVSVKLGELLFFQSPPLELAEVRDARSWSPPRVAGVYLQPLGEFDAIDLDEFARTYRYRGVGVAVLRAVPLASDSLAPRRRQAETDRILAQLARLNGRAPAGTTIIGVTEVDVHWAERRLWGYVFTTRDTDRDVAVVSTARIDARNYRLSLTAGDRPLDERFRKLVTRNIALVHLDAAFVDNPSSVLRPGIMSISDIDEIQHVR